MDQAKLETVESGWTKENLQKLLAAMKACIPERNRMSSYRTGLNTIDWNEVAFPPFSPEECQQKWMEFMEKMRKIRSLTELIVEAEDVISDPSCNIKIHPELSKKPTPPNAAYYKKNAARFKKQHPELNTQQLLQFSVKSFKNLPVEEKAKYQEKYSLETEEYNRQMQKLCTQYSESPSHSTAPQKKRRKVFADKQEKHCTSNEEGLPPKPPPNGYTLFCKEQASSVRDVPGVPKHQYIKEWARRWRGLSETQKGEYIRRSNELKRQYMVKLKSYLGRFDEEEQQQILRENGISIANKLKVKAVKHVTRLRNEPKMPSKSGNVIFCKDQMEAMKDKIPNTKERFVEVNKMWRSLSTKEKERYKQRVNERIKKYAVELQNWFKTLTPEEQKEYEESNPQKKQYLSAKKAEAKKLEQHLCQPSDSEDEYIVFSSSEEEGHFLTFEDDMEEEEEEEDEDDIMFEM